MRIQTVWGAMPKVCKACTAEGSLGMSKVASLCGNLEQGNSVLVR